MQHLESGVSANEMREAGKTPLRPLPVSMFWCAAVAAPHRFLRWFLVAGPLWVLAVRDGPSQSATPLEDSTEQTKLTTKPPHGAIFASRLHPKCVLSPNFSASHRQTVCAALLATKATNMTAIKHKP